MTFWYCLHYYLRFKLAYMTEILLGKGVKLNKHKLSLLNASLNQFFVHSHKKYKYQRIQNNKTKRETDFTSFYKS
jgi:hypothetical protein